MNSYYKILNKKMSSDYKDKIIENLRTELRNSINIGNMHDFVSNKCTRNSNLSKFDINFLLKCYILSQVMNNEQDNFFDNLENTPNPSIKKDLNNNYYKKTESGWAKCNVTNVYDNGDYVIECKKSTTSLKIEKIYNTENQIIELRIKDSLGQNVNDRNIAAELLGLKREFRKRYKLSGYSGNSKDLMSKFLNIINSPVETGFYIDIYSMAYRWRSSTASFERVPGREFKSPLLMDIEFKDNGIAITQEYTGN